MNPLRKWVNAFLDQLASSLAKRLPKRPFRQYLGEGEIFVETKYFNMIVPGWDLLLTPSILTYGEWEGALSNYLKQRVKPGMITFDVGAHMGWFSCLFASCGASVHAFEPNPRLQRILRKNIFQNAGHVTLKSAVNQCAISDYEGVVPMRFPHWLVAGAGLHNSDQTNVLDSLIDEDIITNVTTLDAYARKKSIDRVDVIKIDIEGYEEHALLGAADLISRSPGLTLAMEYTRGNYSSSFPSWLFERFSEAYLPVFDRRIDLKFLDEYQAGTVFTEHPHIDIVLSAR